jgi:hypothetical protein
MAGFIFLLYEYDDLSGLCYSVRPCDETYLSTWGRCTGTCMVAAAAPSVSTVVEEESARLGWAHSTFRQAGAQHR